MSLKEEIRELARQVADLAANAARLYSRERLVALGILSVDAMASSADIQIDERDARLVSVRERLRDRLRTWLTWAKETGRM